MTKHHCLKDGPFLVYARRYETMKTRGPVSSAKAEYNRELGSVKVTKPNDSIVPEAGRPERPDVRIFSSPLSPALIVFQVTCHVFLCHSHPAGVYHPFDFGGAR